MATIITRSGKGSPLTNTEVDNNFTNLNSDKLESGDTVASLTLTSADINGGTIDGTTIGGSTPAAISGTTGQFGTSLNVDGTVTADGLVTDTTNGVKINTGTVVEASWTHADVTGTSTINVGRNSTWGGNLIIQTDTKNRANFASNGDISFYEDTGTTPKFFWDASAEALGIGTSSPSGLTRLTINGAGTLGNPSGGIVLQQAGTDVFYIFNVASNNNTDIDLWNPRNGFVRIGTNNTERMRIDSSGNVGIGTSSPVHKLDVNGTSRFTDYVYGAASGILYFGSDVSLNSTKKLYFDNGSNTYLSEVASDTLNFVTFGFEAMRIDSSGNVGIGTTSPATTLDVNGDVTITDKIIHSGDTNTAIRFPAADTVTVETAGTERMRIDASGNLLLAGTGTPTSSAGNLVLYNGTAPTGNATDGVILYAEDVSASSELKVRDEAGNVTTLSPHNFDLIPEGPSEDMAWSYYSERDGKRINVDMLKAIRLLEQISGEKLVHMV